MAQAYAEEMAITRSFKHDKDELWKFGQGENLSYQQHHDPGKSEEANTLTTWGIDAWCDEQTELNYFYNLNRTGSPP